MNDEQRTLLELRKAAVKLVLMLNTFIEIQDNHVEKWFDRSAEALEKYAKKIENEDELVSFGLGECKRLAVSLMEEIMMFEGHFVQKNGTKERAKAGAP